MLACRRRSRKGKPQDASFLQQCSPPWWPDAAAVSAVVAFEQQPVLSLWVSLQHVLIGVSSISGGFVSYVVDVAFVQSFARRCIFPRGLMKVR